MWKQEFKLIFTLIQISEIRSAVEGLRKKESIQKCYLDETLC